MEVIFSLKAAKTRSKKRERGGGGGRAAEKYTGRDVTIKRNGRIISGVMGETWTPFEWIR